MAKRNFIVLGDTTTHGGTVISAWGQDGPTPMTIEGKPVACVGDKVICPKCRGVHTILSGAEGPRVELHGRPIAREGDFVSDGSMLLSVGQSIACHDCEEGAAAAVAAGSATVTPPPASAGIQSASTGGGITSEEARMLKEQANSSEKTEGKGYVAVFINFNGNVLPLRQHASLFIGRETDKNRTLYDPCGSYTKGAGLFINDPTQKVSSRVGAILIGDQFAYHDYYLFHRLIDGPNVNVYGFEITKSEENQIRERIVEHDANTCSWYCAKIVSTVLNGIGPFKNLGEYTRPDSLRKAIKPLTKMPYSSAEKEVLKRMKGVANEK